MDNEDGKVQNSSGNLAEYNSVEETSDQEDNNSHEDPNEDEFIDDLDRFWPIPNTKTVKLTASNGFKTVSAFAFNHEGTRFSTGTQDFEVRIWDFELLSMQSRSPISSTQPSGQTVIRNLDYSNDDELILVISGSCQATIIAKDGIVAKQYQCPKGDQYLSDMSNTKGHVKMLNDGCWNSRDKENFITCSGDGTVRIWDLNKLNQQKNLIKIRSPGTGHKAEPNSCKYTRDALSIVAGCSDGSLLMWDTRRKFIAPSMSVKNAHLKGSEITGLDLSYGIGKLCSRSEDETCKIWDLRQLKQPLGVKKGLNSLHSNMDCSFSPDDKMIITAESSCGREESGKLHVLDTSDMSSKTTIKVEDGSVIRCKWHPKINHVAYTCSSGQAIIAYDEIRSMNGLISMPGRIMSKSLKRKNHPDLNSQAGASVKKIITPHSLPLFRQDVPSSSFSKIRNDPKLSYKPQRLPEGTSQILIKPTGSTLSSYIAKTIAKPKDDGGLDIRQRILRHDEASQK